MCSTAVESTKWLIGGSTRLSVSRQHRDHCLRTQGLDEEARYEWLTDCYRVRVDDMYVWGRSLRYTHII